MLVKEKYQNDYHYVTFKLKGHEESALRIAIMEGIKNLSKLIEIFDDVYSEGYKMQLIQERNTLRSIMQDISPHGYQNV